ncbi:hypothetical protein [Agromyces sp. SYSU T00266]|uniref:hypothetical protein n=1 Tax=Agromyces zhanjiangensis TaxID=3158562 RepID=UPI003397751B
MGSTQGIQDKAKQDKEFEEWLAEKSKALEEQLKKTEGELEQEIEKYYAEGGWDDAKPYISGVLIDTLNSKEWSLDNVNRILSSVQSSMFGGTKPPEGVEIKNASDVGPSVAQMADLRLYVLGKAFEAVQGILQVFSTSSTTQAKEKKAVEMVAPGMTMFMSIRSASYTSQSFFTRQVISQYFYVFRIYFSIKQAGDISKFNDLMAYEDLKVAYRNKLKELADIIADPMIDFDAVRELDEQLEYYSEKLAAIQAKIEDLAAKEKAAIMARKNAAIQARREAVLVDA